jgi:hypothetical protein
MKALLATVPALAILAAVALPAPAMAGCVKRLPVSYSFASEFAGDYPGRSVTVRVWSKGPAIRHLQVKLYTFGGDLLGSGRAGTPVAKARTVRMRMRYALQPGRYTLGVEGEPNRSAACGPKQIFRVVRFRGCVTTLPLTFPDKPTGAAADYNGALSVDIAAAGELLRNVDVSLSNAAGQLLGQRHFGVLFGTRAASFDLPDGLAPGDYTLLAKGEIDAQPASCGPKSTTTTLSFR